MASKSMLLVALLVGSLAFTSFASVANRKLKSGLEDRKTFFHHRGLGGGGGFGGGGGLGGGAGGGSGLAGGKAIRGGGFEGGSGEVIGGRFGGGVAAGGAYGPVPSP